MTLNAIDALKDVIRQHGADGLYLDSGYEECGCTLDNFMPCDSLSTDCVLAVNRGKEGNYAMYPLEVQSKEIEHNMKNDNT